MADKWVISDTHFFHENIIQYCGRPFANAELMNECMLDYWNESVKPQDHVYHLGDVACGYGGDDKVLGNLLRRLNGKKRLIVGNHDNLKSVALQTHFQKIEMWYGFWWEKKYGITFTHVPYLRQHLRDGIVNGHGHIHTNLSPEPWHLNFCVEHTNYRPTNLDEVLSKVKKIEQKYPYVSK